MRFYLLLLCCLLSPTAFTQTVQQPNLSRYPTNHQKIIAWKDYCNDLVEVDNNRLVSAGKEGMVLVPADSPRYASLFTFFTAVGYELTYRPDSAAHYYLLSEQYAQQAKSAGRAVTALSRLIYVQYDLGRFGDVEVTLQKLQRIGDTATNLVMREEISEAFSLYYYSVFDFEKALQHTLQTIELCRQLIKQNPADDANQGTISAMLSRVASIYQEMGQWDKSIDYLRQASALADTGSDKKNNLYKSYVRSFLNLGQLDSATRYTRMLEVMMSDDAEEYVSNAYRSWAEHYLNHNNGAMALSYANKAYTLSQQDGSAFSLMESNRVLGDVYHHLKNYKEANKYWEKALPTMLSYSKKDFSATQKKIADAYAAVGNYTDAYRHYLIHVAYEDTLSKQAASRNLAEMEARFQNKTKQQHINLLNGENELKTAQLAAANRLRISLIVGIVSLGALVSMLFVFYRNKQRTANLLNAKNLALEEANQTKARLFSIISHDLRSPVSQVFQFLQLQRLNPNALSEEQKQQHNKQISQAAGALLETMEDLLAWSKTQMERFEMVQEDLPLRDTVNESIQLLQGGTAAKNIVMQNDVPATDWVQTDRNLIQVVIRNLLLNAVQHCPAGGSIQCYTESAGNSITLLIANDGKADASALQAHLSGDASVQSGRHGLGLALVREICTRLGATLATRPTTEDRTIISVTIPAAND